MVFLSAMPICKTLTPFTGVPRISVSSSSSSSSSMRFIRAPFLSNHGFRKLLHSVVTQVCHGRRTAEISRRRRARFFCTGAVASDDAKPVQRSKKKISKHERKALVESFVNKYRTLNAGKFPSSSLAHKEVGGCFYVIRGIVQELEYNIVHNHGSGKSGDSLVEKKDDVNKIIPEQEFSQAELSFSRSGSGKEREDEKALHVEEKLSTREDMHVSADQKHTESRQMEEMASYRESTLLEDALNPSANEDKDAGLIRYISLEDKGNDSMPYKGEPVLGDEKKDAKSCEAAVEPNISTYNLTDDKKSSTSDGLRESSMDNSDDSNLQKNISVWTNLKSFADSIFSMWTKR